MCSGCAAQSSLMSQSDAARSTKVMVSVSHSHIHVQSCSAVTFTKGKSLLMPTVAAKAVLPTPGGPSSRHVSSGVLLLLRTCISKGLQSRAGSAKVYVGGP